MHTYVHICMHGECSVCVFQLDLCIFCLWAGQSMYRISTYVCEGRVNLVHVVLCVCVCRRE